MRPRIATFRFFSVFLITITIATLSPVMAQEAPRPGDLVATPLIPSDQAEGTAKAAQPGATNNEGGAQVGRAAANGMISVFVKLKDASLASYKGGIPGLPATSPQATGAPELDVTTAPSQQYLQYLDGQQDAFETIAAQKLSGATITQRYDVILGGVAMKIPANQLGALQALPNVEAVYMDQVEQIETERSPQFIGAPTTWSKLGGQANAGEGVIVGILDSGVWPEHPSFSDPDPLGKPFPAPPSPRDNPARVRDCNFGNPPGFSVPGDVPFTCNNKLIGAYRFMTTYETFGPPLLAGEFRSSRDDDGHGTHTATTAAGNRGVKAEIFDIPRGTVSGIAPRAHVINYKVCGIEGCFNTDSAAAVQQAIRDGVDVINFSISGGTNPYGEVVALAFLDAYNAGVFVAASAGNSGPTPDTVNHRGPWITTVAASNSDRSFLSDVTVTADNGDVLTMKGASVTPPLTTPTPVVAPSGDQFCLGPFAPGTFTGRVVVCARGGGIGRVQKGINVRAGGAVGMILYNPTLQDLNTDNHWLPTVHVQSTDGAALLNFIQTRTGARISFTTSVATRVQGDVIAAFSSRGGTGQTLGVNKPDITAPGVQILAGNTPLTVDPAAGPQGELFQAIQGTSMSSPHIAGAAALIKDLYPNWTPGQIKSALMTTAKTNGVVKEDEVTPFTPFDAGSGRVDLRRAWDPGLTFSETGANFVALQNELWKANYPSVFIPTMPGLAAVSRTAQEVSGYDSFYKSRIEYQSGQPRDFKVTAPAEFFVAANGAYTFDITIDARDVPIGAVRFATVVLTEKNGCVVRLPVTIIRRQPIVTMTKNCAPGTFPRGGTTECSITMTNNSFSLAAVSLTDNLPVQLKLVPGSVTGGATENGNGLSFNGTLTPVAPPNVTVATGSAPFGYVPLAQFGITPITGVSDESITNFNTSAFSFGGETWTRIGMVSNGYLVVGGGTAADVQFENTNFPNALPPNNVLAPFWTDLNPAFGGQMRAAVLTSGSGANLSTWLVYEWSGVVNYGNRNPNSFQVWIGANSNPPANRTISFAYSTISNGDAGLLTVGAENRFGNRGQSLYFNGVGTLPTAGSGARVSSEVGAPGETRIITFRATGERAGTWTNYAEMTSPLFFGTNIARFQGEVTQP